MLILDGGPAFPDSKQRTTQRLIQESCPKIQSVDAIFAYLVHCTSEQSGKALAEQDSKERKILNNLLRCGGELKQPSESSERSLVYVLPRIGSISPWSSKATEISAICHLGHAVQRLERIVIFSTTTNDKTPISTQELGLFSHLVHDRMTQVALLHLPDEGDIFQSHPPRPLRVIELGTAKSNALERLAQANTDFGLALSKDEIAYLADAFQAETSQANGRNPTDAELFMFAQVNSDHCRHKIFNASWTISGVLQDRSLFQMIKNTEKMSPAYTISAYSDNAAVFEGYSAPRFFSHPRHDPSTSTPRGQYTSNEERMPIVAKVETHNHPTAVSPYPGAATGSGGEIRDEGAVGRGSTPKAGLSGFAVSNLNIPGFAQPWETEYGRPSHIASSLDIMLEAPLGSSGFNNEFGRPALAGYFRTFLESVPSASGVGKELRGYHKPIMVAGGLGHVRPSFVKKSKIEVGAKLIVLGGPGMLIGLGGGAASSQVSGSGSVELDFASVQRENAEMERRCQEVINACVNLGDHNPIQSVHDVGAGGLSNALPELVHDSDLGARLELRDVLVADSSMSPMEIWCNESQERYVLAVGPSSLDVFVQIAKRERCPFAVVGVATKEASLVVTDRFFKQDVINLDMNTLFGSPPRLSRNDDLPPPSLPPFDASLSSVLPTHPHVSSRLADAISRVLSLPSVASKSFLITIGDRSVTGLVTRDQMVGPWQVPVADVAVTRTSYGFGVRTGEAMAMGERPILALINAAASAKMAVAESIMNIVAASIEDISRIKLSANWMCAASKPGEGARLYEACKAIGMELCPALGIGIPVGKDSMSMSMRWSDDSGTNTVSSPLSLNITAFAPVSDIRRTWTPQLNTSLDEPSILVLFDLSGGKERLGGSALAQVYKQIGNEAPNVEDPQVLKAFFAGCQAIKASHPGVILAYHDRSDGGLFTTVVEMCFAGRTGAELQLDQICFGGQPIASLFNEELGAVVQIRESDCSRLLDVFGQAQFPTDSIFKIGSVQKASEAVTVTYDGEVLFSSERSALQTIWGATSYQMQRLRDDPAAAQEEFEAVSNVDNRGVFYDLKFSSQFPRNYPNKPRVAILREQGINGHVEMAWAFSAAGFDVVDVHMSDIVNGEVSLDYFRGLAACGGFSYGDVLGAGNGWASSVLFNEKVRAEFRAFFKREDSFTLAVCNGCQFLSSLKDLIPGVEDWPRFAPNRSNRFEARVSMVRIEDSSSTRSSVFLRDMVGSLLPIAVAHGEGRATFDGEGQLERFETSGQVGIRYVDSKGEPTLVYPQNPNGSPAGITGVQSSDGRILALMPHPERVVTLESNSWYPHSMAETWNGVGPWFRLFESAREWCAS